MVNSTLPDLASNLSYVRRLYVVIMVIIIAKWKIAAREPFTVYILLPMWMEGIPAAGATQGLLHWQRVTIEAMHKEVQKALDARMATSSDFGLKVSDYLNFYCLGTRETERGSEATARVSNCLS